MPKKTKKEKIIADYRRKMASVSLSDVSSSDDASSNEAPKQSHHTFSYIPSSQSTIKETTSMTLDPQEFLAIKKDLLWTIILTICILMAEVGLWNVLK